MNANRDVNTLRYNLYQGGTQNARTGEINELFFFGKVKIMDQDTLKDKIAPIMAQPKQLTLLFNLSRTAVGKFINEMLLTEEFKAGVTRISHNLTLVNVELFMEFLKSKDMANFK